MTSDLTTLFQPGDDSASVGIRQGVVESWDSDTAANTIRVAGGQLLNVPVLVGETVSLAEGDVVALLTTGDRWFLLGKVTDPGDPGTVPTWTADITALTGQVETIQTVTIPAVQNDVVIVQGDVIELTTVTVPAVQDAADAAQSTADTAVTDAAAAADAAAVAAAAAASALARFPITETDITDGAISTPKLAADAIDGLVITGAWTRTAATGPRIGLNDPAYPNQMVYYTDDPDETAPAGIRPIGVGGSSLQLRGPDLTTVASPATLDLSADNSTSESSAELDADRVRLTAATDAIVEGFTATIQGFDGAALVLSLDLGTLETTADLTADRLAVTAPTTAFSGALDVTGALTKGAVPVVTTTGAQSLTNKDLSAASNVFPATLTPRTVYKTADTTINNSTTLTTDPHLQIAGIAAGTYTLDALILYSSSGLVGANWKGFFQATGSLTDRLLQVLREPLTGNEYGVTEGASTFTAAGQGVGAKRSMRIFGSFVATAGGQAFNLQWAQNTAEATNTVVYKGSYYRIQRIA